MNRNKKSLKKKIEFNVKKKKNLGKKKKKKKTELT
jgi:hypothetical protein